MNAHPDAWEPLDTWYAQYEHPFWKSEQIQQMSRGHGGMDFLEDWRLIVCLRETPLSGIAIENMLKLSREGAVITPVSPPWYQNPKDLSALVSGFTDKVLHLMGEPAGEGWREDHLE